MQSELFTRRLWDDLSKLEQELFHLVVLQDEKQVKEFLQAHKNVINFHKQGDRGYNILQTAVLSQNKKILAALLATRKCEPIDKALALAAKLHYNDAVNILLKYTNSKNRLNRSNSEPLILPPQIIESATRSKEKLSPRPAPRPSPNPSQINPPSAVSPQPPSPFPRQKDSVIDSDDELEDELMADGGDQSPIDVPMDLIPTSIPIEDEREDVAIPDATTPELKFKTRSRSRSRSRPHRQVSFDVNLRDSVSGNAQSRPLQRMVSVQSPIQIPIALLKDAACSGNYVLTKRFVQSGFRVADPSENSDTRPQHSDTLKEAVNWIETYRALCSPTYIAITAEDPISVAFHRSQQLLQLSQNVPEHGAELKKLSDQSSDFAVKLLELCESSTEVEQLMMVSPHCKIPFLDNKFGRLFFAVCCKQKKFVAHTYCQHIASNIWLKGFSEWSRWGFCRRTLHVFLQAFLMIFVSLATIIDPDCRCASYAKVPLNRFLYYATSYFIFLALCLAALATCRDSSADTSWILWALSVYVLASWNRILVVDVPLRNRTFLKCFWSMYDVCMYSLILASLICIMFLGEINPLINPIGKGLLAVGCILALLHPFQWFLLHYSIGPFIIAFSKICAEILKLVIVFVLFYISFSVTLYLLYRKDISYQAKVVNGSNCSEANDEKNNFNSVGGALAGFFWTVYGYGESTTPQVTTPNENSEDDRVTEFVGNILWGFFHIAGVTILINMVIALMTNTYQRVLDDCDKEWKYQRTKFWLYYFEDYNALPPPFNVILFLRSVFVSVFRRSSSDLVDGKGVLSRWRGMKLRNQTIVENGTNLISSIISVGLDKESQPESEFSILIKTLTERYFEDRELKTQISKSSNP